MTEILRLRTGAVVAAAVDGGGGNVDAEFRC